jgi:hypothetical protein
MRAQGSAPRAQATVRRNVRISVQTFWTARVSSRRERVISCHVVGSILAGLAIASCARMPAATQVETPSSRDETAIDVRTSPVPLNPQDPTQIRIGAFTYAGGFEIRAVNTPRLHGLSDLAMSSDGHLVAVTDEGDIFEARLVLDTQGRLSGLVDGRLTRLIDLNGRPLRGKARADAEGLAVLPNGDRLVSFERNHRIWRYPAGNGRPVAVQAPAAAFPENEGLEALTSYPIAGSNAYLAGSETGRVWLCTTASGCQATKLGSMVPAGFALTAMAAYGEDGNLAILARAFDTRRGPRAIVRLLGPRALETPRVIDELSIAAPLTRDNFEGVAVVPQSSGALRLYLVSDDNFSTTQHTYLLAFDWTSARQ